MIELQNISLSINGKELLTQVSAAVAPRDVIALIGNNGNGKTSLLHALNGTLSLDDGHIATHASTIDYVSQDSPECSVGELLVGLEVWRTQLAFEALNLHAIDKNTPLSSLSGGQATKVRIAAVLARDPRPTLLLLDEPTNNLDSESIEWLTGFLKSYDGSVIFASHDRAFIDEVATKIWHISDRTLEIFSGNYTAYETLQQHKTLEQTRRYEQQQLERKRLMSTLHKAKVQSSKSKSKRASDSDKMAHDFKNENAQTSSGKRASALESRIQQMDTIEPVIQAKIYATHLKDASKTTKRHIALSDVTKEYSAAIALQNTSMEVWSGQRIRIAGKNGAGKSTLLGIIAGRILPSDGDIRIPPSAKIGYFSQDIYGLKLNESVYANLAGYGVEEPDIYKQCRSLGITEPAVAQPVERLSRGQQAKVGFVKLLLGGYDILILDEPTNHLDIEARTIIENALVDYRGAIVFASHDEYFAKSIGYSQIIAL